MATEPTSLQEAIVYFSSPDNCVSYLVERRWPDGVVTCPTCGSAGVKYVPTRRVWQCKTRHAKCQFSVKVGTVFEDSPIPLDKWLMTMWMIANSRNGVSSHEVARSVKVTQKSAWFMVHRIRLAMKDEAPEPIGNGAKGAVEADETWLGGKPKNMHVDRRIRYQKGDHKAVVMGMIARDTREVRAMVIPNVRRETLQKQILANVGFGTHIYTDQHVGYDALTETRRFVHKTVNHTETYVKGKVHTNSIENFWSLLKRNLAGTYVAVEPFHLDRYLDEQMFRFNNRIKVTDAERMSRVAKQVVGRRLTYAELTGKHDDGARRGPAEATGAGEAEATATVQVDEQPF